MLWWHLSHEQHFFFYLAMAALLALVLYLIFRVGYKWCGCDKTSDADVDADSLLYQAPSSVTFVPVTQYSEVRKDRGSGADQDVSVEGRRSGGMPLARDDQRQKLRDTEACDACRPRWRS